MRTDAHDQARVRDPAIESMLLSHTTTVTDNRAAADEPVDNSRYPGLRGLRPSMSAHGSVCGGCLLREIRTPSGRRAYKGAAVCSATGGRPLSKASNAAARWVSS
jgi:hypothetical protein